MGKSLSPYIPYNLQINMCDHQYHNNDIITTASIYNVEHKRFRQQILQCVQTYNSDHEKLDNSKELTSTQANNTGRTSISSFLHY